jgi:hypothetical protein
LTFEEQPGYAETVSDTALLRKNNKNPLDLIYDELSFLAKKMIRHLTFARIGKLKVIFEKKYKQKFSP